MVVKSIFDAHFHIIDPKFPLVKNQGYLPPYFTVKDYLLKTESLNICGGAVVSGSFQAFDQSYLINSLQLLGKSFYGVANIPWGLPISKLELLGKANIKGVRFNLKRGGSEKLKHMVSLSNRLYQNYNWHTELYLDSKDLPQLSSYLKQLPKFSIDHLGLSKEGLPSLLRWVEKGIKVKASGFGRVNFSVIEALKQIHKINPHSLLFGTDLPSTRADKPFCMDDLQIILDHFSEENQQKILLDNAKNWYGSQGP